MTTRGRPGLVGGAIASAIAQTMTDLEIVVVIDGADPETEAAVAAIVDPRLRVVVVPVATGAPSGPHDRDRVRPGHLRRIPR